MHSDEVLEYSQAWAAQVPTPNFHTQPAPTRNVMGLGGASTHTQLPHSARPYAECDVFFYIPVMGSCMPSVM